MFCYLWIISSNISNTCSYSRRKNHGSGNTALIISIEEIKEITKIFKSLEESELLIEGISETIKKKQINKKADFFPSILGNALAGEAVIRAGKIF